MSHSKIQQFAQKAFVINEGNLLCVRKSKDDPSWPLHWEIPGGRMEFGEDVDSHICREVREETCLDIIPGQPFYIWQWSFDREGISHQVIAVARLTQLKDLNHAVPSLEGQDEFDYLDKVEWVPLEHLGDVKWVPNIVPVIDAFFALPEVSV